MAEYGDGDGHGGGDTAYASILIACRLWLTRKRSLLEILKALAFPIVGRELVYDGFEGFLL
jgi:hypothetical protein